MPTLFVLTPPAAALEPLFATTPPIPAVLRATIAVRTYPPATDTRHLLGLIRAGRDPRATRWRRGAALAVVGGAALGGITNGVLAGPFGMLGGLLSIAVPLGIGIGAFLGGFTAAMAGTETARAELRALAANVHPGDRLAQCNVADPATAALLRDRCTTLGWPAVIAAGD